MIAEFLRDYVVPGIAIAGFFFGIISFISKRTLKQQAELVVKLEHMKEATDDVKDALTKHVIDDATVQATIKTALDYIINDRRGNNEKK